MKASKDIQISEATLKRLPRYLHFLKKVQEKGILTISAALLARELHYESSQVTKDLAAAGASGRPRVGYSIDEVIAVLDSFLGFDQNNEAFLVGAGHLGKAMLSYPDFQKYGLHIVAAFDQDRNELGRHKSGINIIHMDKFREFALRLKVHIVVLTCPSEVAQEVTEHLVDCGIKAIWNLTPTNLNVPADVVVQNTSMYAGVAILLNKYKSLK